MSTHADRAGQGKRFFPFFLGAAKKNTPPTPAAPAIVMRELPGDIERFRSKQVQGDGCWGWTGSIGCNGYAQAYRSRKSNLPRKVDGHRYAWELAKGPIANGLHFLHRCGTKECTRVDHLYLGAPRDNAADAKAHGASNRRVLSPRDVLDIVTLKGAGAKLAARFGVSHQSVANIVQGRTHSGLTGVVSNGART